MSANHEGAPVRRAAGRRDRIRLVLVALGLTVTSLAGPSPAVAAGPADELALAERHAPVVRLVDQPVECGPGEPFTPTDVEAMLGDGGVALRGPWTTDDLVKIAPRGSDLSAGLPGYHLDFPGSPLSPGCTYEQWARQVTTGSVPTTYARVVTEPGREGLALQYWLYYPFNDFNNKHESDWEMVQLEFAASDAATALQQEPTRVGYSQHEGVELAAWDDPKLERVDGTRPVVHPASGSHANYFDAALFLGRSGQQGFGCDDTRAPTRDVEPAVELIPSDAAAAVAAYPWLGYQGHWGQREASFYNGPTGPNTKDQWTAPLAWTDAEGVDTAYAVPGSGLYGTRATSAFCEIVAVGSGATRLAIDRPELAALALAAVALVVAWLVRRTTWRPSAALRLGRRRSTGQVLASVWRMYLGHLPLFVGIGVPIAVATILPGVASTWLASTAESLVEGDTTPTAVAAVAGLVLAGLSPVILSIGQAAAMTAVVDVDAGREAGPGRAYAGALRRAVPLLLTQVGVAAVVLGCLFTVVLAPLGLVVFVLSLLLVPVVLLEHRSGWDAVRRSAQLVRPRWVKVVVLVALTFGLVFAVGPALGTALILSTSLPFGVSNAVAGVVYALLMPLVALNSLYVYADAVARDELEPRGERVLELPAEVDLTSGAAR